MKKMISLLILMPFAVFANGNHEQNAHDAFNHTHEVSDTFTELLNTPTIDNSPAVSNYADTLAVNSITLEAAEVPSNTTTKIENTPDVLPPPVYPTVPCFKGGSFGFGVPGIGASIGGGKLDPGCVRREMIRIAPSKSHGMLLWCTEEKIVEVFGSVEACLGYAPIDSDEPPTADKVAYCEKRGENIEESLVECLEK